MDPIRVLHVIDTLQLGGTEWQCLSLAARLDPAAFQSTIVCFNRVGPLLAKAQELGLNFEVLDFSGFRRPGIVVSLARLAVLMRRRHVHVTQAYGFYSNVAAMLAGRLAQVPVLFASRRDMGEFLTRLNRRVERLIFRLADRVVVNAAAIRDELAATEQTSAGKIALIPTGVNLDRFDRQAPRGEKPEWVGKGKVVAMVARFRRQKDQPTFLRAAKRILSVDPTVVFVLVGDGYLKESTEQFARDLGISQSVWFVGAVAPDQMPAFLKQVDVSVLASKGNEGIPNVVLEAMAAEKPVVATDAGGCREAVQDGVTGFLVPPEDPEQLAEKILWLLRENGQAALMGKAGRERVETEFSLDRMVERFSSLYADLAHQKLGRAVEVG